MANRSLRIIEAAENNLRAVSVSIPLQALTVVTGPSGSGKSSLAVNTLLGESSFRLANYFGESYSAATRAGLRRPKATAIENLPPVLSFEASLRGGTPHTVASFLGLDARIGSVAARSKLRTCPRCSTPFEVTSRSDIIADITARFDGRLVSIAAVPESESVFAQEEFPRLLKLGIVRVRIGAEEFELEDLDSKRGSLPAPSSIELTVERLRVKRDAASKLEAALSRAAAVPAARIVVRALDGALESEAYSERGACSTCGRPGILIRPEHFDLRLPSRFNLGRSAHHVPSANGLGSLRGPFGLDDECVRELSLVELGPGTVQKVLVSDISDLRVEVGRRKPPIDTLLADALDALSILGLGHLSLLRTVDSLSLGERRRLYLLKSCASPVGGMLHVLDEPSAGLHESDLPGLVGFLDILLENDGTLVVVDHHPLLSSKARSVIALGPGSGRHGGSIVEPQTVASSAPPSPPPRLLEPPPRLRLESVRTRNLKNVSVEFPTRALTCVVGVSGAGKSSLLFDSLLAHLDPARVAGEVPPDAGSLVFEGTLPSVACFAPSDRLRRHHSTVATYAGFFGDIRELFAAAPLSRERGYTPRTFSLTHDGKPPSGGRCPDCRGTGHLSDAGVARDLELPCSTCGGSRYSAEVLDVTYRGFSIGELLERSVEEVADSLKHRKLHRRLSGLLELGLGHLPIGQVCGTLSSGEFMRLELARLSAGRKPETIFILDEPTMGLDHRESRRLTEYLRGLIERGATVICSTHSIPVMLSADHLIEIGPGAGRHGGSVVFSGTPAAVPPDSPTGRFLKQHQATAPP